MKKDPKDPSDDSSIRVRRGCVDSVDLYEIKDSELDLLEKGSPSGLFLNFSIFLFSIAFSAIASICTAESFKDPLAEKIFIQISFTGIVVGLLLLVLWYRGRGSVAKTISEIRERIPPEKEEKSISTEKASKSTKVQFYGGDPIPPQG